MHTGNTPITQQSQQIVGKYLHGFICSPVSMFLFSHILTDPSKGSSNLICEAHFMCRDVSIYMTLLQRVRSLHSSVTCSLWAAEGLGN